MAQDDVHVPNRGHIDMTPLDKPLRRELVIGGERYTLLLDPEGLKLTPRGHRQGVTVKWADLASGDAAPSASLEEKHSA